MKQSLARKREAKKRLDDGQKIIIGGMMLSLAERDESARKRLVELLEKNVTREADVRRIHPIIEKLRTANNSQKNS